tara:strand:- start:1040 stop:1204 length:165 start_codon:yes stop_codon:yes gene_type:complete
MLVLYTEEQLMRAYKVYIREFCTPAMEPDVETFRRMFEDSESIQNLSLQVVLDN